MPFVVLALVFGGFLATTQAQTNEPLAAECNPDDIGPFNIGDRVTYEVIATGGTGSYDYDWRGTENLSGSGKTTSIRYEEGGSKGAAVLVTSGDEELLVQCGTIQVYEPPLRGYCTADVYISDDYARIDWRVRAFGGVGDYEYDWSLNSADEEDRQAEQRFEDPLDILGAHNVRVDITSGDPDDDREITVRCGVTVDSLTDLERTKRVSCDVPTRLVTDRELEWDIDTSGLTDVLFNWLGTDGLSSDLGDALITYTTAGLKEAVTEFVSEELSGSILCQMVIADADDPGVDDDESSGDGCFIATAAYGTYMEDDVVLLRNFRDNTLRESKLGNAFISAYYTVSPPIANIIRESELLKAGTRMALAPIISVVGLIER